MPLVKKINTNVNMQTMKVVFTEADDEGKALLIDPVVIEFGLAEFIAFAGQVTMVALKQLYAFGTSPIHTPPLGGPPNGRRST